MAQEGVPHESVAHVAWSVVSTVPKLIGSSRQPQDLCEEPRRGFDYFCRPGVLDFTRMMEPDFTWMCLQWKHCWNQWENVRALVLCQDKVCMCPCRGRSK